MSFMGRAVVNAILSENVQLCVPLRPNVCTTVVDMSVW